MTKEVEIKITLIEATGSMTEVELERENSCIFYEIEIEDGTIEVDLEVAAN